MSCPCHGAGGIRVDDERRADVAIIDIPEEGSFDGCDLSIKCGLDGSEGFAVGGQGFTLPFRVAAATK
jgi:hypothetical protein